MSEIVDGIWADLSDRSGFDLDTLDDETQAAIRAEWERIVDVGAERRASEARESALSEAADLLATESRRLFTDHFEYNKAEIQAVAVALEAWSDRIRALKGAKKP